ncbi:MAG: 4Fe-4S dicluster domain-containing protein [Oscillospiraceae bacterium]|nr:4Fe-4S dicluster domain-containing protein [Oscillospiraceae bacterium]
MGIHCETRKCTGCGVCAVACIDEKDQQSPLLRHIDLKERMESGELHLVFNSHSCFHCVTTRCAAVCPTGSIIRDTETGIVLHDNAPCIGCGKCADACPFGAIFFDTNGIIQKCDGCIDRVRHGFRPVCVEACPQQALEWEPNSR